MPHFLRLVRAGFVVFTTMLCLLPSSAAIAAGEDDLDTEEREFLRLINNYRASNGLPALVNSRVLSAAANWMSTDMANKNYFNHTDSLGRDPFVRMSALGYGFNTWRGENIAAGRASAAEAFDQWRNSPGHDANMRQTNFKVIGIARAYAAGSTYKWYWTTDFGGFVDPSSEGQPAAIKIGAVTNAASYAPIIARGAIATLFGENMAADVQQAQSIPLPTKLGTTQVKVNGVAVGLFFVSPGQINFAIPDDARTGAAQIEVVVGDRTSAAFSARIDETAPGLFTAKADGKGAVVGAQTFDGINNVPLTKPDGTTRAVDAGELQRTSFLVLYGSGWRFAAKADVRVTINGLNAVVDYAGKQGAYVGLDQLNVRVPYVLRGAGEVELVLTIGTTEANRVKVRFQ